jgi:hypothetical protein
MSFLAPGICPKKGISDRGPGFCAEHRWNLELQTFLLKFWDKETRLGDIFPYGH